MVPLDWEWNWVVNLSREPFTLELIFFGRICFRFYVHIYTVLWFWFGFFFFSLLFFSCSLTCVLQLNWGISGRYLGEMFYFAALQHTCVRW